MLHSSSMLQNHVEESITVCDSKRKSGVIEQADTFQAPSCLLKAMYDPYHDRLFHNRFAFLPATYITHSIVLP